MGEFLNRIRERMLTFFNGLSRNRKIMLIVGTIALILLLTFSIMFMTRTEYVVIAQGVTPADASTITTKLDEIGISWRASNDTSVISVPESDVSRARMELAVSVDSGTFSWPDVFGSESITMTSQTREQMYIQANAADVKKAIETITSVEKATVILQIPKDSNYFIKDEIESRASVVLNLRRGETLSEMQVSGIENLIVSAVKNLKAENITILDASGVQLNNPEDSLGFTANSQFDMQTKVQRQLQNDLTIFLEKIYGVGNVEVQPNLVLDFNQEVETQKLFSPPIEGEINGMVRSLTTITENVINDAGATGAPGTDSNTGEATSVVESDNQGSSYEKASETLNYELNEIYREIVKAQGDIRALSIGVLINSQSLVDGVLTDAHRTELMNLISMSAGTDMANIRVMVQEFPDPMANYDIYTGQETGSTLFGLPIFAVIVIILVTVVAIIIVLLVMKRRRDKLAALALEDLQRVEEIKSLEEIESHQEDKGSPKYHIEKFVDNNPEAAVALLRAWLNEM